MDLKELSEIANREMRTHGLSGWTFGLADTKRRLGVCKYRAKRIEIARFHVENNPKAIVLDTLFHEIAHAIAGPRAKHGPAWKTVALRLGATPLACDTSDETIVPPGDWQATCASCGKIFHRYKRPVSLSGYRCRCPARSPLVFDFKGDPALRPDVPLTRQESAKWEAKCDGCKMVHFRTRKPKPGVWHCRCRHQSRLVWTFRSPESTVK